MLNLLLLSIIPLIFLVGLQCYILNCIFVFKFSNLHVCNKSRSPLVKPIFLLFLYLHTYQNHILLKLFLMRTRRNGHFSLGILSVCPPTELPCPLNKKDLLLSVNLLDKVFHWLLIYNIVEIDGILFVEGICCKSYLVGVSKLSKLILLLKGH